MREVIETNFNRAELNSFKFTINFDGDYFLVMILDLVMIENKNRKKMNNDHDKMISNRLACRSPRFVPIFAFNIQHAIFNIKRR